MNQFRKVEKSTKRPVNLTADSTLVSDAKALGFNLSQIFEEGLRSAVYEEKKRRWQEENREAIEAYNERIEREGTFGEQFWRR
jgi:antitoxin CcdA